MMNDKVIIVTDQGEKKEATAPVIISASRSTDIPAFYAKWFFNRLAKGYCVWYNPFNQQPMYISFKKCRVVVFWTKNPEPIIPFLEELDKRGIHYYFQVTLNDYMQEGFEPNVPPVAKRIETFKKLQKLSEQKGEEPKKDEITKEKKIIKKTIEFGPKEEIIIEDDKDEKDKINPDKNKIATTTDKGEKEAKDEVQQKIKCFCNVF